METYDAVILADGDYPTSEEALRLLDEAQFLVCCDRAGMEYIRRTGKTPNAIVGDGDSLPQEFKERYESIWHQVEEQEYNDLTKATKYVVKQLSCCDGNTLAKNKAEHFSILYLGATGKREDHTLGNIALMTFYYREFGIVPTMVTDYGSFRCASGTHTFKSYAGQQVSIFRLSGEKMSSEGLKWEAYPYRELWQGTLNEAEGDSFTLQSDGEYIVFQTHK